MKRFPAYPALVALLMTTTFAGCRQDPLPESGSPIRFSVAQAVISAETTKADNGKPHGEEYLKQTTVPVRLYGSYAGSTTPLFDGIELFCTNVSSNVWAYSPLRYWAQSGTHSFRAVFPFKDSGQSYDAGSDKLNITFSMADGYDLMVASAEQDAATRTSDLVELPFKHACAAVRFLYGKTSEDTQSYSIKELKLQNMQTTGTLTYTGVAGTTAASMSWTSGTRVAAAYTWTASTSDPALDVDTENKMFKDWFYVVPQALNAVGTTPAPTVLLLKYMAGDQEMSATLDLNEVTADHQWEVGCAYTYTILVNPKVIGLTVSYESWNPVGNNLTAD